MIKRILSAGVAIPVGIILLFFYDTIVLNIVISIIALVSTYEILMATKYLQNKLLCLVGLIFVSTIPFYPTSGFGKFSGTYLFGFALILFIVMLFKHKRIRFEQIGLVFLVSTLIPYALSSLIYIRSDYPEHALFYIVFTLIGAWIADAGAYFVGTFFGKHKLAPTISPKKTVEGFIGGIVTTAIVLGASGLVYKQVMLSQGKEISANIPAMTAIGVACAFLGLLGDLSASIIKRECLVKDFGNIMPGHGGMLDRFDSVLFVAPFMYQILGFVQLIK